MSNVTSAPKQPKKFALDIFSVLARLNKGELSLWSSFTPEEQKGFAPYVITRWLSGTKSALQLIYVNEFVNANVFSFTPGNGFKLNHNELLCKLMAVCGDKVSKRFVWKPEPKKNSSGMSSLALQVIGDYFEYSQREAIATYHLLSREDVLELANELGYQDDELKKLKKELSSKR